MRIANEILMLLRSGKKKSKEISLYEPIGVDKDGETVNLLDVLEVESTNVLEIMILEQNIQELYRVYENSLKDMEKKVIGMRYGLFGRKECTQREVAECLGISRSYVSRIEKKAVEKMRKAFV